MYIFGGCDAGSHHLGDLTALVIASRHWYTFQNMGPSPPPQSKHQMCVHNEKIFMVGEGKSSGLRIDEDGYDYELAYQDSLLIYALDTSKIRFLRPLTGGIL